MMVRRCVVAAAALLLAAQAQAVIKVEITLESMYKFSRSTAVGTIGKGNADNRVLEINEITALRGAAVAKTAKLQIFSPEKLFAACKEGEPVAIFVEREGTTALVHIADTWLLANQLPNNPNAWRTVNLHDTKGAFPGRTKTLVKLLEDMKAGKGSLLNEARASPFAKELAAAEDAKFGPSALSVTGAYGPADEEATITVGDKGLERKVGDAVDNDLLLTGAPITSYHAAHKEGLKPLALVPMHVNGDKRLDLLIVTKDATLLLINRGYGVFLVDPVATPAMFANGKAIYDEKTRFAVGEKGLAIKFGDDSVKMLPFGTGK